MASGQYAENIEKRKMVTNEFWLASLAAQFCGLNLEPNIPESRES